MNKEQLSVDFQQWAKSVNYEWSGALDAWIASYELYAKELNGMNDLAKKYAELTLINQGLKEQIANLKHLVDFIEEKSL